MKILCINPNSSKKVTESIKQTCEQYALPDTEVTVECVSNAPIALNDYCDIVLTEIFLLEMFKENEPKYDGFIIACHGDVGVNQLRELTDKPVIGIGEASLILALPLGHKFSILSRKRKKVVQKEEMVKRYGLENRCASIKMTQLEVNAEGDDKKEQLIRAGKDAVKNDGAEVLVLGCGGMAGLDKEIEKAIGVPVIDGVVSALMIIESLIRYGLKTSKVGKYS